MKNLVAGVALALASTVAAAAGGVGTPEAAFSDIPQIPTSLEEADRGCKSREARLNAMIEKAKSPEQTPPAGANAMSADEMKFVGGWADLGKVQGEKMYNFTIVKEKFGQEMKKCSDAVVESNVPDRRPGMNKCYLAYLSSIRAVWPDYLNASHDLVVLKGDYIAKAMEKTKDAGFKYRLTVIYRQGLWAIPHSTLGQWADITCGADIPER